MSPEAKKHFQEALPELSMSTYVDYTTQSPAP